VRKILGYVGWAIVLAFLWLVSWSLVHGGADFAGVPSEEPSATASED